MISIVLPTEQLRRRLGMRLEDARVTVWAPGAANALPGPVDLPGVVITAHVGGDTDAVDERVDRVILEQLRRLRAGEPPVNLVYETAG